jgi:hypothetical protein
MPKLIRNQEELQAAIRELESLNYGYELRIRETAQAIADKWKPLNLLKSGVRQVVELAPSFRQGLLPGILMTGAGWMVRKFLHRHKPQARQLNGRG